MQFLWNIQCHPESSVQLHQLPPGKRAYKLGKIGFAKTYKIFAHDPAWMFESLVNADRNLG